MLYSALALMLGHNFIPHHHNYGHKDTAHHHHAHDGAHHHDHDTEDTNDWGHLFLGIQHGVEGLLFLTSHSYISKFSKQIPQSIALHSSDFTFRNIIIDVPQKVPPYIASSYNSRIFLPCGLRAPPFSIV